MKPAFHYRERPLLEPRGDESWAGTAVLNPALLADPRDGRLHMLFRASGPGRERQLPGTPLPYPIALGYAWSDDGGETWEADFDRPALYPNLDYVCDALWITDALGRRGWNYANGCIEDPRLVWLDGQPILTVACRIFPAGPFWLHDDPVQCMPAWALEADRESDEALFKNHTVSVAYRVDLPALSAHRYDDAFQYLGPLTNPARGDNRDVILFPERLSIRGKSCVALLHRPKEPAAYDAACECSRPSIFFAAAPSLEALIAAPLVDAPLATPLFSWEGNRIGASWPPLPLGGGEWLLPYHGKQDDVGGYSQSFMILREREHGAPEVIHRSPVQWMRATADWELNGLLPIPCLFSCGGILKADGQLLVSYGAADTRCGLARIGFNPLVAEIRKHGSGGERV